MDVFDEELSAAAVHYFQYSLVFKRQFIFLHLFLYLSSVSKRQFILLQIFGSLSSVMVAHLFVPERPAKQHKPNGYNLSSIHNVPNFDQASSCPLILTFGNPNMLGINPQQVSLGTLNPEDDAVSEVLTSQGSFVKLDEATNTTVQTKAKKPGGRTRLRTQNYDHVVAERKRYELFSQSFMALSTIVPGLKKMHKTFILEERAKKLEEQTMEPAVLVKKPQLLVENEGYLDDMAGPDEQPRIEI
ncbi:transcription factor bHLH18-like [Coffea arabica]|uniref:Transcription factor bHLH18-like n=1 Tax=Coffea arabica TaxID=13443 RepID=A0ABM4WKV2_COFAR